MRRSLFLCCFFGWAILGSATPLLAQGTDLYEIRSWAHEASQKILKYLHVYGADLVVAVKSAGPIRADANRVIVAIRVERSGRIAGVSIAKPSGYPRLDRMTMQLVKQAGPLPPLPVLSPAPRIVRQPVAFKIRRYGSGEFFRVGP